MKSFLRYVETGKARSNAEQPLQDDSSDAGYQKALSNVGSVVPLPPDFVSPLHNPGIMLSQRCIASCQEALRQFPSPVPLSPDSECSPLPGCKLICSVRHLIHFHGWQRGDEYLSNAIKCADGPLPYVP